MDDSAIVVFIHEQYVLGSGDEVLANHRGGPASIPGHSMLDLW